MWWNKLLPELCKRARLTGNDCPGLISSLKGKQIDCNSTPEAFACHLTFYILFRLRTTDMITVSTVKTNTAQQAF